MKKLLPILFTFFAAPLFAQNIQVLSYSPQNQTYDFKNVQIQATFDSPMVSLGEESQQSLKDCPFTITPKAEGVCRWTGTQTVTFEAKELAPSTKYSVVLSALTSKVNSRKMASTFSWTFETERFEVRRYLPYEGEQWVGLEPTIIISFNFPVKLEDVKQAFSLSGQAVTIKALNKKEREEINWWGYEDNTVFSFKPNSKLEKGRRYNVNINSSLKPINGNISLRDSLNYPFYTYDDLKVVGAPKTNCLPYSPNINFTNPVYAKDLMANIKVSPAVKLRTLSEEEGMFNGNERRMRYIEDTQFGAGEYDESKSLFSIPFSYFTAEPGKKYTITIGKNLKDIYGNILGSDVTLDFSNTGYCPAMEVADGFGVLESYLRPFHPVEVVNVKDRIVKAIKLDASTFIPIYNSNRYSCSERNFGAGTVTKGYSFGLTEKDKGKKTYINVAKLLDDGIKGLTAWQVQVPRERGKEQCWKSIFDNITDAGMTLKSSPEGVLVWVTNLKDTAPMANVTVEMRDADNNFLWEGRTDENGFALSPSWSQMGINPGRWSRPEIFVFAKSQGGTAVMSTNWNEGIEPWRFSLYYEWYPKAEKEKAVLVLNRDLIKPGEKLHIKGIVRAVKNGDWVKTALTEGTLTINDSRGKEYAKEKVKISKGFGTFSYMLETKSSDPTGYWNINFEADGEDVSTSESFRIEAVKPAEFKVNINTDKEIYAVGDTMKTTVDGWYMFGAPMAKAEVKVTTRYSDSYFNPKGYHLYNFNVYWADRARGVQNEESAQGTLDDKGRYTLSTGPLQVANPVNMYIEVSVTAPNRQQLFARTSARVNPADFYLGIKTENNFTEVNTEVEADIIALNLKEEAIEKSDVTVDVVRRQWLSVRKTGVNGRLEWVSEETTDKITSQKINIKKSGAKFKFTPKEPGEYRIMVSSPAKDTLVAAGAVINAAGKGTAYWDRNEDDILKLVADKENYKPGDEARIMIKSPYENATALVSVEREGILEKWTTPVKGTAEYIKVPIKENYLPNVYVSVVLIKGRAAENKYDEEGLDTAKPQAKFGYVNLSVEPAARKLDVKVSTDKKSYRPREQVTVEIKTELNGKGIPTENAIFVVDEGLLALTAFKTPDVFKEFYAERALSVSTVDNRLFVIGQRSFGEKGENRGGGGGADSKLGGVDLRTLFDYAPYANPALVTDASGKAKVSFTLPDNLSKFRVMVVSLTDKNFGSADANFGVNKPVMLKPSLPRFARLGDEFKCGAVLYNFDAPKTKFDVEAAVSGDITMSGALNQTVNIEKGGSQELLWDCKVTGGKNASFTFKAKSGNESDGLEWKVPVYAVEKYKTLATSGVVEKSEKEKVTKPEDLNELGENVVELSFASTALLDLRGGIMYLLGYPYGCLEQKMSKILPIISAETMVKDFNLGDLTAHKNAVQDILNNLADYQSPEGGFGYWPGTRMPDQYVTAYALEVIALAKEKGYKVNNDIVNKAAKWLLSYTTSKQKWAYPYAAYEDDIAKAYAIYVLSLYGKNSGAASQFSNMYAKKDSLNYLSRIYLLMAAKNLGQAAALDVLAQDVTNAAKVSNTSMHFEVPEGMRMPWLHMSNVKASAMALEAMLKAKGGFTGDEKVVKWLLTKLTKEGNWGSTNVNAAVFKALNSFYTIKENTEPDFTAELKFNAAKAWSGTFKGRSFKEERSITLFETAYKGKKTADVEISKIGAGRLYYTLSQVYAPGKNAKAVNMGFDVKKEVKTLNPELGPQLKAGQRAEVTITVTSNQDRTFVVLEDFLPAGFEILDSSLATESQMSSSSEEECEDCEGEDAYYDYWGGFGRSENYDDRVAVFADYLTKGTHVYKYKVQATTPGTYSVPSAWVSQMYEPEVLGHSTTSDLKILLK